MSSFVIEGGLSLGGEIRASGNKNAALPMIAAALLTDEEVILENVPRIRDVEMMLRIAEALGADVQRDGGEVRIRAAELVADELPPDLGRQLRAGLLFIAPLLLRHGRARGCPPGGDVIGRRRLDAHFYGFEKLGATVEPESYTFTFEGSGLRGADMFFDEASVTATEHILMAAVLAEGTTVIRNAAAEPHVQDLIHMLNKMGADIKGQGTNTLTINGVSRLRGVRHRIDSDHIEVGSFLALAAATGGEITIHDVVPSHYWMIRRVFERLNFRISFHKPRGSTRMSVHLPGGQEGRVCRDVGGAIPQIADGPWPQFPTDLMSAMIVLATQCEGTVLFFEKMFESRMYFVDSLIQMGAGAVVCDVHRVVVNGRTMLHALPMRSPDIRAGMALLIAALCAKGTSSIDNAEIIDRGYERIEERLLTLGARIKRAGDPAPVSIPPRKPSSTQSLQLA